MGRDGEQVFDHDNDLPRNSFLDDFNNTLLHLGQRLGYFAVLYHERRSYSRDHCTWSSLLALQCLFRYNRATYDEQSGQGKSYYNHEV
jgi:hypothetical protein